MLFSLVLHYHNVEVMKKTKLFIVFAMVVCLASCDFIKPKSGGGNTKGDTIANSDAIKKLDTLANVIPTENQVSEKTFEWSFDLLWDVFVAYADLHHGYGFDEEHFSIDTLRKNAEESYGQKLGRHRLSVPLYRVFDCGGEDIITCFKYQDEDQLYVFYESQEGCAGGCLTDVYSYNYDMKSKSLTEVAFPFMPLDIMDFFDELMMLDSPDKTVDPEDPDYKEIKNLFEIDPQYWNCDFMYDFDTEGADFMLGYQGWFCPEEFYVRGKHLAYDWNGHTLVRKPEADVLGTTIYKNGVCGIKRWSIIPDTIAGYNIEQEIYWGEGGKSLKYVITKDDKLIIEIEPFFDYVDTWDYTDQVVAIRVFFEGYQTAEGLHVGSRISDVLAAYPEAQMTEADEEGNVCISQDYIQFMAGEDGVVKMIRVY